MPHKDTDAGTTSKPSFWARFRNQILLPELTPEQVALSFALGFSIAWNPILGLHTWIALACCFFIKKLHRPLLILSTFINNPIFTMMPIIFASFWLGNILLGNGFVALPDVDWAVMGRMSSYTSAAGFMQMVGELKPVAKPYFLGGAVLSILAAPIGYWFMLKLSRKMRKTRDNTASNL